MNKFLSAEELRDKRFLPRNLPEKAAAKGCDLEDDIVGDDKLERLLDERRMALGEPKVEKLSSLIKGEWLPDKQAIRILKQVGKHLQHMGRTVEAQHLLYPEEALFLMDTKCMEVYHRDVTLSEQEAYSVFFGSEADLHRYQVYAHLSRLGYTVIRHQGRLTVSAYERTINLDKYMKRGRKAQKTQPDSPKADPAREARQAPEAEAAFHAVTTQDEHVKGGRNPPRTTPAGPTSDQPCLLVRHPEIGVPNAYGKSLFALLAAHPQHLPPNVQLRKEMYTVDLQKLYARHNMSGRDYKAHCSKLVRDPADSLALRLVEASSWREEETHKRRKHQDPGMRRRCKSQLPPDGLRPKQDFDQFRPGSKRDHRDRDLVVRASTVVSKSEVRTQARSWKQYKRELTAVQGALPAFAVLATSNVRPLLEPAKATSTAAILSQLQIIKSVRLTESSSLLDPPDTGLLDLAYDVYLPSTEYKKNACMLPNHRLVITSASDPLPELVKIMRTMRHMQDGVAIHFAVVNHGDVAFYSFKDVQLPVLVSMG